MQAVKEELGHLESDRKYIWFICYLVAYFAVGVRAHALENLRYYACF